LGELRRVTDEIRDDLGSDHGRIVDDDDLVDMWGRLVHLGTRTRAAVGASIEYGAHADCDLAMDFRLIVEELVKFEKGCETKRDRDDKKGWAEWLESDWRQGAKKAHMFSRAPRGWHPTTATSPKGVVSAAPTAILDAMRRKYEEYWSAADAPLKLRWGGTTDELPRLAPAEIRAASLLFARKTASTYDGWHVRHFALIGDEGLGVLATLLAAVEVAAKWPTQTSLVSMPLIGKPKGGHRAIGKLSALYRVWAKTRRPIAAAWEARHDRPYLAAAAGAGPIDAIYRQAMRQEAACANGGAAAVVLEDMESFYETVNRDLLLAEAQALEYPMHLLRASLAAYAAPRVLTLNGIAAKELHPRRGLIAGCTFATTLVKVFYIRCMDTVVKRLPSGTDVDMYIDDVAVLAEGPKDRVAAAAIRAHGLVKQAITEKLGCKLAPQKAAVIASHKAVGQRIARALNLGDGLVSSAPNLGTDATAGKARSVLRRGSRRWQRYRIGALRKRRFWAVARAVGRKAITIFTAGISPGITYGDEIWGVPITISSSSAGLRPPPCAPSRGADLLL
jgi:hypothetical protein